MVDRSELRRLGTEPPNWNRVLLLAFLSVMPFGDITSWPLSGSIKTERDLEEKA